MELSESSFFLVEVGSLEKASKFPGYKLALGQLCIGESLKCFAIEPEPISPSVFSICPLLCQEAALQFGSKLHPREPLFGCLYCVCFIQRDKSLTKIEFKLFS